VIYEWRRYSTRLKNDGTGRVEHRFLSAATRRVMLLLLLMMMMMMFLMMTAMMSKTEGQLRARNRCVHTCWMRVTHPQTIYCLNRTAI